ncbi:hypothetical protein SAMN05216576_107164 [Ectopseudomonas chengduensis]|uniref:Uncharacterized protein n=1 Tax=Ectopseudomonas chengduensis TaxID=489632 RepID=A0A1G6Q014_9GAMM|nr:MULTISPECIES: hypothetical protein [Pseudomonas]MBP3061994.1 hypothetical protein [Pseudomonas chengduensis]NNB75288.1 hypothetical protein [Pseudomonas chengduensis]OEO24472.1 hypothetical protein AX279_17540 [Pseudomonas sp. J237]SDC85254.1 hypothetical protein SAMN05216576_107164 [Pseudomonas chengduensis]
MLDDLRFPSGVTFAQAKKDAKRLAKSQSIPHTEALDRIAAQHGLALPWAKVTGALREFNAEIASLSFPVADEPYFSASFTGIKNEALVAGDIGPGKLVSLIHSTTMLSPAGPRPVVLCSAQDQRKCPDLAPSIWQEGSSSPVPGSIIGFYPGVSGYPDVRSLELPAGTIVLLDEGVPESAKSYWPDCQAWARSKRIALVYLVRMADLIDISTQIRHVNRAFVLIQRSGQQFTLRDPERRKTTVDFSLWSRPNLFKETLRLVLGTDPETSTFYLHKNSTPEAQSTTLEAAQRLWAEGKNATVVGRFKGM